MDENQAKQRGVDLRLAELAAGASDYRKAAGSIAAEAIKGLLLLNGGAIVAILAFMGNAKTGGQVSIDTKAIQAAMGLFAQGAGAAVIAAVLVWLFYDAHTMEHEHALTAASEIMVGQDVDEDAAVFKATYWVTRALSVLALLAVGTSVTFFYLASTRAAGALH